MRVAVAQEWIGPHGGAEAVFRELASCFAHADLYALTADPDADLDFGARRLDTTFLDRIACLRNRRQLLLPLMPLAWRWATKQRYDLVLTSSHACVKGFRPGRDALHLCYCHTPMRYAWLPDVDRRRTRRGRASRTAERALRAWDRRSAEWVDSFAANSTAVRDRIRRFYDRDARVIHPPVDTEFFSPDLSVGREDFVVAASRFVPYKRLDLAIEAAALADVDIAVAGAGPDEARLRSIAERHHPGRVRFEIAPNGERLRDLYRRGRALVYPAHEDFGIVPVEAQACGTPVVALRAGGTTDSVVDGMTGSLVDTQDAAAFAEAIGGILTSRRRSDACIYNASRFSVDRFRGEILDWAADELATESIPTLIHSAASPSQPALAA